MDLHSAAEGVDGPARERNRGTEQEHGEEAPLQEAAGEHPGSGEETEHRGVRTESKLIQSEPNRTSPAENLAELY